MAQSGPRFLPFPLNKLRWLRVLVTGIPKFRTHYRCLPAVGRYSADPALAYGALNCQIMNGGMPKIPIATQSRELNDCRNIGSQAIVTE